ncbi:MAG: methyltransferase domain-containing protein [Endozoicomonadaceae bacterium]|nr:methyltransferase domain-containing protein [Endozoicomonadaceae bacterium]
MKFYVYCARNPCGYWNSQQTTIDGLIANMMLHHTPAPNIIFQHPATLLKPGGNLIISEISVHDQHRIRESCGDIWLGFHEELTRWAQKAGFTVGESQHLELRNGFQIQGRSLRCPLSNTVIN